MPAVRDFLSSSETVIVGSTVISTSVDVIGIEVMMGVGTGNDTGEDVGVAVFSDAIGFSGATYPENRTKTMIKKK